MATADWPHEYSMSTMLLHIQHDVVVLRSGVYGFGGTFFIAGHPFATNLTRKIAFSTCTATTSTAKPEQLLQTHLFFKSRIHSDVPHSAFPSPAAMAWAQGSCRGRDFYTLFLPRNTTMTPL
ncbi:predicted protein [Plenodomus lingam JN3]|uniref:Predicted protein n=1 Tax=Leptosphaeria maculans (strain JN3 / isolate v23.1.3 / race Av1-4-5-6-7-8) TaxID=985895 RepID=E4ZUT0_LEPMJ|nr:predicted protein [Plenodomus lingam JN3]CBX95159.1 predicted protein [Plenodomus lingam JN3]